MTYNHRSRGLNLLKKLGCGICLTGLLFGGAGCTGVYHRLPAPIAKAADIAQGEYYIEAQKFAAGIQRFEPIVTLNPMDGRAHYYLGRFYLAQDQPRKARATLQRAVSLSPRHVDSQFWLGIAYAANKQPAKERKSYIEALKLNSKHVPALVYLGHNLLAQKQYANALKLYDRALEIADFHGQALYNRALALQHLGRYPEEVEAWKVYLEYYPTGPFARRAVRHLNARGNFEYRNYLVCRRVISFKRITFEPAAARITRETQVYLRYLATILERSPKQTLHILAYQKNNPRLAQEKAKQLKAFLLDRLEPADGKRIKISWFGVPEKIEIKGKLFSEAASVNLFTLDQ